MTPDRKLRYQFRALLLDPYRPDQPKVRTVFGLLDCRTLSLHRADVVDATCDRVPRPTLSLHKSSVITSLHPSTLLDLYPPDPHKVLKNMIETRRS